MGKQVKGGHKNFRKEYNNNNPYNKLQLNKFHQVQGQSKDKYGHQLHKKKRDLERIINYRKSKNLQIEEGKLEELKQVEQELEDRKKGFQKQSRKQFFLQNKYKQIMNIEKRKVAKKIRQIKEQDPNNKDLLLQWINKLNYVKHFPKNLKYISLFPNTELSEKASAFQKKIMEDIKKDIEEKREKLNKFQAEYKGQKRPSKKDDFFLSESEEQMQNQDEE